MIGMMKRSTWGKLVFGLVLLVGVWAGTRVLFHRPTLADYIGEECEVFFRHDVLGQGNDIPSSVTATGVNGADVSIKGELLEVNEDWVVLKTMKHHPSGDTEIQIRHVPLANVLFIERETLSSVRHTTEFHQRDSKRFRTAASPATG